MDIRTLKQVKDFISACEALKMVTRHNWMTDGRQESVAEHTWRMLLLFLTLQEYLQFDVDVLKVVKMIVIHDIPEAIYGDLPNLPVNAHLQGARHEREERAARELFGMLPEPLQTEYYDLYMEFEHQGSLEAKVGKALDRIEAQLQHVDSGPEFWTDEEIGDTLLTYPESVIESLWDEGVLDFWKIIKKEMKQLHDDAGLEYSEESVKNILE